MTIDDYRAWILAQLDRLEPRTSDTLPYEEDNLFLEAAACYAEAARQAGDRAARLGFPGLHRRSLDFGQYAEWLEVKTYLSECLAAIRVPEPAPEPVKSPYLDAKGAADYLGITVKSLYGLVSLGRLEPLRGSKRSYRFTTAMLDEYLQCHSSPS